MGVRTKTFQSFRMFNNPQVTKWLTWKLGIRDRFLNLPVVGRKKNDILYTTGFGFNFAR